MQETTLKQFFDTHACTPLQREELATYLVYLRMRPMLVALHSLFKSVSRLT